GEIGAGSEIRCDGRRYRYLHVETGLSPKKSIPDLRAGAVVFRRRGSRQNIRVSLDIADAIEGAQLNQLAFMQQLVQPLGAAPGAPQVLLVLAPDEAAHVESESQILPPMKAQRAEWESTHGGPSGRV